jgi:hypothetical protein
VYLSAAQPRRRGRGLRGLGQEEVTGILPGIFSPFSAAATYLSTPSAPVSAPYSTAADCSLWDFFFNSKSWQACARAAEASQIATVPANAAAYGYTQPVINAAQASADAQIAMAPSDVEGIAQYYGAGSLLPPLPTVPTWVLVAGAVAGGLLLIAALK